MNLRVAVYVPIDIHVHMFCKLRQTKLKLCPYSSEPVEKNITVSRLLMYNIFNFDCLVMALIVSEQRGWVWGLVNRPND